MLSAADLSGDVRLSLDFVATLNDKMRGFYRSKYRSAADGENKYMASTQFEVSKYASPLFILVIDLVTCCRARTRASRSPASTSRCSKRSSM